ncbi:MAG: TetR/AcrR family transcriptional regulator [Marmoricola sp.]
MGRWEPDARQRLQHAAMTLFRERGYDAVTVAEIAAAAGLTRRTFFNHFPDKREIFFSGAAAFEAAVARHLEQADPSLSPLDAALAALTAGGTGIAEFRAYAPEVRALVASSTELRERDLMKSARVGDALAAGLRDRGAPERAATLAARLAFLAFDVAWQDWVDHPEADFAAVMADAVRALREQLAP